MKKRVKLLTTIASLCLAVALMAFGVYAASATNLTVSSNVSFTAGNANITWKWAVSGGASANAAKSNSTGITTDANTGVFGTDGTAAADLTGLTFTQVVADQDNSSPKTITISFTVQNHAEKPIEITIGGENKEWFTTDANINFTAKYFQGAGELAAVETTGTGATEWTKSTSIAKNGYYTYVVTLTVADFSNDIAAEDQTLSMTFVADDVTA